MKIDLKGKRAFIAGVADDQGFGWAIAKALADAGAEIIVGTWPPVLKIFQMALNGGKLDTALPSGGELKISQIVPLDAVFDVPEDVPQEILENKRYAGISGYTISEVAKTVGPIDILVHSLANGPEVKNDLLDTSRRGYLAAVSASAYSFVSLVQHFQFNPGGSALTLTYMASERTIPGYGGGMSSAKAALESDTRTLAFEAGRKHGIRVNVISAGPLPSRAARAIGMIEKMCDYYQANAPLQEGLTAMEVGTTAAFLSSPLASGITGSTIYVDKGYHSMGRATQEA
jgi:enoyl-[acyl-carrier protein] reductase I